MMIEERLAIGHGQLRIISSRRGKAIAESIRDAGFAVTELSGRGRDGTVAVLSCSVKRREIDNVQRAVHAIDPQAFITVEDIRPLHRGYWRA
jgi:uncharacterized protein YebE (UPF0316 family)